MNHFWRSAACVALALAALGLGAETAQATTFDFSFSSGYGNGSGQFVTSGGASPYLVTGITGFMDGNAITGLDSFAGADQQLFLGAPNFDTGGISFDAGGIAYNLTDYPDGLDRITNSSVDPSGGGTPTPLLLSDVTISAVPEPLTLSIFGAGLAGAAAMRRRKKAAA